MTLLNRESLLKKEELQITKVDLGDNFVFVKEMTGRERELFERSFIIEKKGSKGSDFEITHDYFRAKLAVITVCDKDGKLLLKSNDYIQLSTSMGASKLQKIADAAQKLNGISEEDKEDLVKNSEGDLVADSNSDSVKS